MTVEPFKGSAMRLPRTTTRGLMVAVAGAGVICAVFAYQVFIGMMIIFPLVGAIRGASQSPKRIPAAVRGGVKWGAVQAGVYDAVLLLAFLAKDPPLVLFHALSFLEMSLVIGLAVGVLVGVGFLLSGPVPPAISNIAWAPARRRNW